MQTGLALLLPMLYFNTLSDWPNRLSLGKDFHSLAYPQSQKRFQVKVSHEVLKEWGNKQFLDENCSQYHL